jgi:nifR3 family TIM-barrel protein
MAGFTDTAFRAVCLAHGAALCFTEMVSCEGIIRGNGKTLELLGRAAGESLLAVQLFTADPVVAAEAAERLKSFEPALIDLNCGCPVPKVVKSGAGAGLARDIRRLGSIVRALADHSDAPVTAKLRAGWDADSVNSNEAGRAAEDNGAAAVCLHPRTRAQGYSGRAAWDLIGRLKQHVSVPVFGSGDLFAPEDAARLLCETHCDGVMFARGALGNPFIFELTRHLLSTGHPAPDPSPYERLRVAQEHLRLAVQDKGERVGTKEMKKHLCAYTKGLPGATELRNLLVHADSSAKMHEILTQRQSQLP